LTIIPATRDLWRASFCLVAQMRKAAGDHSSIPATRRCHVDVAIDKLGFFGIDLGPIATDSRLAHRQVLSAQHKRGRDEHFIIS